MFIGYQARRDCEGRYAAIRPLLDRFKRRFTVVDFGGGEGWFADRIARDYCASVLLVEGQDLYRGSCPWVRANLDGFAVHEWAKSDHVDVLLCLSALHHVPDWRPVMGGMFALAEHVVLEYPNPADVRCFARPGVADQHEYLAELDGSVLGKFTSFHGCAEGRTMKLVVHDKTRIDNTAFYYERRIRRPCSKREHRVYCDYETKTVDKGYGWEGWTHGFNLWTYAHLGGVDLERIKLERPQGPHGDLKPWNYILDEWTATPIDYEPRRGYPDDRGHNETFTWLRTRGPMC